MVEYARIVKINTQNIIFLDLWLTSLIGCLASPYALSVLCCPAASVTQTTLSVIANDQLLVTCTTRVLFKREASILDECYNGKYIYTVLEERGTLGDLIPLSSLVQVIFFGLGIGSIHTD